MRDGLDAASMCARLVAKGEHKGPAEAIHKKAVAGVEAVEIVEGGSDGIGAWRARWCRKWCCAGEKERKNYALGRGVPETVHTSDNLH